jgi:hypothetical protein
VVKGKIKYARTLKWHLVVLHKLDYPEFMELGVEKPHFEATESTF